MTHVAQCSCICSKINPWLLHDPNILHPRLIWAKTLHGVIWRGFTLKHVSEASQGCTGLPHHLCLHNILWKKQMITKGQTTAHNQCCKCYTYMVQLLAKMAPAMATGCYSELDQCEVFLGNYALMNGNWQEKVTFSVSIQSIWLEHIVTQESDCSWQRWQNWLTMWLTNKWLWNGPWKQHLWRLCWILVNSLGRVICDFCLISQMVQRW